MPTPLIIAISGASGSGKSLFTQNLIEGDTFNDQSVLVLREDHYYRAQDHLPMEERVKTNYDHPNAFEHELLEQHLTSLRRGESIEYPNYCYKTHTRLPEKDTLQSAPVIVLEGIMLLTIRDLLPLYDIKIFIDTPLDICLLRRTMRDVKERGRTLESVAEQYEATVKPMYHRFIEPSRYTADVIVTQGGKNQIALDIMKSRIQQALR